MWVRRTLVVLGLLFLHLTLVATVTLETADFAWAPSYFDGDDGDGPPFPLSERLPALVGAVGGLTPLLAALAVIAVWPPIVGRQVSPACVRLRAPPRA